LTWESCTFKEGSFNSEVFKTALSFSWSLDELSSETFSWTFGDEIFNEGFSGVLEVGFTFSVAGFSSSFVNSAFSTMSGRVTLTEGLLSLIVDGLTFSEIFWSSIGISLVDSISSCFSIIFKLSLLSLIETGFNFSDFLSSIKGGVSTTVSNCCLVSTSTELSRLSVCLGFTFSPLEGFALKSSVCSTLSRVSTCTESSLFSISFFLSLWRLVSIDGTVSSSVPSISNLDSELATSL